MAPPPADELTMTQPLACRETTNLERLCSRLDDFLKSRFGYKSTCAYPSPCGFAIDARRKKYDLNIRVIDECDDFWGGKAIIVSRIGFHKTRQGHGADLLMLLVNFARERQYEVIGIEQAGTPLIQCFAEKYGFKRMEGTNHFTSSVQKLAT